MDKFSFFIPVYNEEKRIRTCLESILAQDYPVEDIEILIADGGSTDRTKEICASFDRVKLFDNPRKLADFGIKICITQARGELFVIFAADNALPARDWLKTTAELFQQDAKLACAWCRMISAPGDSGLNKYYTLIQNDPLSFFINKNLKGYLRLSRPISINGRNSYIFDVDSQKPLIWGANGLVYRTALVKEIISKEGFIADNDVFQTLIEQGDNRVAYTPDLSLYHHHVKSIRQWVKKWQRDFGTHFLKNRRTRNMGWAFDRDFKRNLFIWIVYTAVPVFSIAHTLYLWLRDKDRHWLYHPLMGILQLFTYASLVIFTGEGRGLLAEMIFKKSIQEH